MSKVSVAMLAVVLAALLASTVPAYAQAYVQTQEKNISSEPSSMSAQSRAVNGVSRTDVNASSVSVSSGRVETRTMSGDEPGGRVLAQTSVSEAQYENGRQAGTQQSAGQQTEPLGTTATINRGAGGEIESISIDFTCGANEEIKITDSASITLEETGTNPEQFRFTNGDGNASIAVSGSTVTISPATAGADFIPDPVAPVTDGELLGDTAAVETQSGVSCGTMSSGNPGGGTGTNTGAAGCSTGQSLTDIAAFNDSVTREVTDQTGTFTTTGSSFQVTYGVTGAPVNPSDPSSFQATLQNSAGAAAGESFTADLTGSLAEDTETRTVNLPAGTYRFEVVAQNVQYDITIAECRTASSDPSQNVISGTIPNKMLVNTGGPRLTIVTAGVLFVCVGASLGWILLRRGRGA